MSDRYMKIEEIEAAYPEEWVLVVDLKTDRYDRLLGGRVVFHHPDRDRVYDEAESLPVPCRFAAVSTCKPAANVVFSVSCWEADGLAGVNDSEGG